MSRKEKIQYLQLMVKALLCGLVILICAYICIAQLMKKEIIGEVDYSIWSKLGLAVSSLSVAAYIGLRLNCNKTVPALAANMSLYLLVSLCALCLGSEELNPLSVPVNLLILILSSLIGGKIFIKRHKNKKLRNFHK